MIGRLLKNFATTTQKREEKKIRIIVQDSVKTKTKIIVISFNRHGLHSEGVDLASDYSDLKKWRSPNKYAVLNLGVCFFCK